MSLMVAQEVPTSTTVELPHGPTGVAEARRRLRADLYARNVPEPVIDDAVLILSELLSNSCRHARPLGVSAEDAADRAALNGQAGAGAPADALECGIRAFWAVGEDGLLAVEVTDGGGPTRPRPGNPAPTAQGGRGLGIVGSLALRWGVRDAPGEVTVWALLAVRGRHARRNARRDEGGTGIGLPRGVQLGLPLDLAESLEDLG